MKQPLSDSMKAILIKIALALKSHGWVSDKETNEIEVYQGYLSAYKEFSWDGDSDLPNVAIDCVAKLSFEQNEQNQVYFLVYSEDYSLFIDGVGNSQKNSDSDLNIPFSESDVNNTAKFQQAANEINNHFNKSSSELGYEFAQESYEEWKNYSSGDWKADQDLDR